MEKMAVLVVEVTNELEIGGRQTEFGIAKTRQVAYLHGTSAYPDKWTMKYEHTERPIEPGLYVLGGGSFRIGKFGPEITKPDLLPLADAVKELQARLSSPRAAA